MKNAIKNNMLMMRYLSQYCSGFILLTILNSVISSGVVVLNIFLIKFIVNALTTNVNFSNILMWIIVFFIANVFSVILNAWMHEIVAPRNTQILNLKMKLEVFKKSTELDIECYETADFYNKFTIAINQSEDRALAVLNTFSTLIGSLLGIVSLAALLTSLEPILLLVVTANVSISLFLYFKSAKIRHKNYKNQIPYKRAIDYTQRVFYLKEYAKEIRLFNRLPEAIRTNYSNAIANLLKIINKYGRKLFGYAGTQGAVAQMAYAGTMLFLAFKVFYREITVADFIALSSGSQQLSFQLMHFVNVFPQFYEYSINIENFIEFMKYKPNIDNSGVKYVENESAISFVNVSFSYPGSAVQTLCNVNIKVSSGEKVAFVGRNGAGKTTLIKLITRLYDPTEGYISLNDIEYKRYNVSSLRQNIGVVFQDFQTFSISIAENVLMRPIINKVEDEQTVICALKHVGIYEKISQLSNGIYTVVTKEFDDNGVMFSGGELQKIAIARLYAQSCSIVILDEPSSALDAFTEDEIFKSVLDYASDKTVVLISHRLSNVKNVDRIYYISDGYVVETGTHSELIALDGEYASMFNAQADRFISDEVI